MLRSVVMAAILLGGQPAFASCFAPDEPGYLELPLRKGVYGCYDSDNNFALAIGLLDQSTYRDDKGTEGTFSYEPGTGVLTITTGSYAGARFLRQKVGHFCVMHEDDRLTRIGCAFDEKKNIDTPPW